MKHPEPKEGWIGGNVKCDLCGQEWLAVYHESSDKLECPHCKQMNYFEPI